ncbi:N-alpha-acetyltransferase 38-A, NatC auxiliary subunit [Scaptodrosophila lebanonensis]|uniref:N-alpha-acetyltransferase 38-A, NatC auxiliary subunit n=1 Tax=Drosophila lebanonensis TaxID=7225 RepID=A0A6J2U157_DROLE|nr:N-alpha-acetyltransferase 38-A, NatC auxiliary subunit [Scaptodrosophila lebanonensis]
MVDSSDQSATAYETAPPVSATNPFRITTNAPHLMNDANITPGRRMLQKLLGRVLRIVITDGRVLVGYFNCTDRDCNIVLSMCAEYLVEGQDPRILGNVMVPGKHIVSLSVDMPSEELKLETLVQ